MKKNTIVLSSLNLTKEAVEVKTNASGKTTVSIMPGYNLINALFEPLKKQANKKSTGQSFINQSERASLEMQGSSVKEKYCEGVEQYLDKKLMQRGLWKVLIHQVFIYLFNYDNELDSVTFMYKDNCMELLKHIGTHADLFPNDKRENIVDMLTAIMEFMDSINNDEIQLAIDSAFVEISGPENIGATMGIEKRYIIQDKVKEFENILGQTDIQVIKASEAETTKTAAA